MASRKPTVLTPTAPRKSRAKPKAAASTAEWSPRAGQPTWRSRPTKADPFTDEVPGPTYGTEEEVRAQHASDTAAGLEPMLEVLTQALWSPPWREVPTVADLAGIGEAHQLADGAYKITPRGYEILREAMRG